MRITLTLHRLDREKSLWLDRSLATLQPQFLIGSDHDIEATLDFGGKVSVRDTAWPLVWRLCLEPAAALLGGKKDWHYRCYASSTTMSLRADGDTIWVRRDAEPEIALAGAELWPVLVGFGAKLLAVNERAFGPASANNLLLAPALEKAQAALQMYSLT